MIECARESGDRPDARSANIAVGGMLLWVSGGAVGAINRALRRPVPSSDFTFHPRQSHGLRIFARGRLGGVGRE